MRFCLFVRVAAAYSIYLSELTTQHPDNDVTRLGFFLQLQ